MNNTHEILQELESHTKAQLKDRAVGIIKNIREHVEMRNVWISQREKQRQDLEELQMKVLHSYDTANKKLMEECQKEFQEIIERKTGTTNNKSLDTTM